MSGRMAGSCCRWYSRVTIEPSSSPGSKRSFSVGGAEATSSTAPSQALHQLFGSDAAMSRSVALSPTSWGVSRCGTTTARLSTAAEMTAAIDAASRPGGRVISAVRLVVPLRVGADAAGDTDERLADLGHRRDSRGFVFHTDLLLVRVAHRSEVRCCRGCTSEKWSPERGVR